MEKRAAARELAFLALFQLPKNPEKLAKTDLQAICLSAVRTLADHSKNNLKKAEALFLKAERSIMDYKLNHPDNETQTEVLKEVKLPMTDDFLEHIDACYKAVSLMREGLQIPETYWHYHDKEVEHFSLELVLKYTQNKEEIDNLLTELSKSWDFSRIRKIDKVVMQLALAEMLHSDTPNSIIASEAVKLANKYSSEEGVKFVNGVLADAIKTISD